MKFIFIFSFSAFQITKTCYIKKKISSLQFLFKLERMNEHKKNLYKKKTENQSRKFFREFTEIYIFGIAACASSHSHICIVEPNITTPFFLSSTNFFFCFFFLNERRTTNDVDVNTFIQHTFYIFRLFHMFFTTFSLRVFPFEQRIRRRTHNR